jgi:hypothetical protein
MTLKMHNLNVVLSVTRQEMTLKMQHIYRKKRSQHVRGKHQALVQNPTQHSFTHAILPDTCST